MKRIARWIVIRISWWLVKRLLTQHDITIVAVAGSVGKTSTKRAIAQVVSQRFSVAWQDGNYNDIVSVPLVFFGLSMPSLMNPLAWFRTFKTMHEQTKTYSNEIVVLELGTDAPGQIAGFSKYLQVDIGVVTPIAPEHMEFFGTLEAVASEELSLQNFSKEIIVHDSSFERFPSLVETGAKCYGLQNTSDSALDATDAKVVIKTAQKSYKFSSDLLGTHQLENLAAACLVAEQLGVEHAKIQKGLAAIQAAPGRMQKLKGIYGSVIIDDTYNASPEAVTAALDTLYSLSSAKKIAVLGNMNELGETSAKLHEEMGVLCNPKHLELVITIGPDANEYLAKRAEANGCNVIRSDSPYDIGEILKKEITAGTTVLLKGSQNGVFLEEAIKPILADKKDVSKLVRQSKSWLAKKQKMFA